MDRENPPRHQTLEPPDGQPLDDSRGLDGDDRARRDPAAIRSEDTEPYLGLQYIARLFKIVAMVVVVALVAEIVAAFYLEGASVIFALLAEVVQGTVLAAVLWGVGDLTLLLIDAGHDVRASRILLGRMSARQEAGESMRD